MAARTHTVGSSAYETIKRDIIFGRLSPGAKLKLSALRTRYGASVSTLRETLSRLASEGFVAAEEQRGFFVTPVSEEDLIEITDLRILLECSALRESIKNGDADWEGHVVAAHHKLHRMEKRLLAGDDSEQELWKRYDWEFHEALVSACNSRNLRELHAIIYDKYLRYQVIVLTNRGADAVAEHKAIFDAALDRDADRAQTALEAHIRQGLAHTLAAFPGLSGAAAD